MSSTHTMIHVLFSNNGNVAQIGEKPPGLSSQEWFDNLTHVPDNNYQPFAGGRGMFRIPTALLAELKSPYLLPADNA